MGEWPTLDSKPTGMHGEVMRNVAQPPLLGTALR